MKLTMENIKKLIREELAKVGEALRPDGQGEDMLDLDSLKDFIQSQSGGDVNKYLESSFHKGTVANITKGSYPSEEDGSFNAESVREKLSKLRDDIQVKLKREERKPYLYILMDYRAALKGK